MTDQAPPAGWYPDPELPGSERYWTGQGWGPRRAVTSTAYTAPAPAQARAAWQQSSAGLGQSDARSPSGPGRGPWVRVLTVVVIVALAGVAAYAVLTRTTWWRSPAWRAGYADITAGVPQNRPVWLPAVPSDTAEVERAAQGFCAAAWPVAQTLHDLPAGDEGQYVAGCQAGWVEISDRLAAP